MGYRSQLLGAAQHLGDGRYGVLVEVDDQTYYVEHAVNAEGLVAQIWDESRDELINERAMGWPEVIERMMTVWQQGVAGASPDGPSAANGSSPVNGSSA